MYFKLFNIYIKEEKNECNKFGVTYINNLLILNLYVMFDFKKV